MTFFNNCKKHLFNFRGKKINTKYIVFESDDWGSERIPSRKSLEVMGSLGIDLYNNPFNYLDSLETENDLTALFDLLLGFSDFNGNHPVITANSVVANPDFSRIRESGYRKYHYESITDSYSKKNNCRNSLAIIKEGIENGIFHPQFHGREHLNIRQWLLTLQSGDQEYLKAFDNEIFCLDKETAVSQRSNLTAAFDFDLSEDKMTATKLISEGTALFRRVFGFNPASFIAPCYVWHPSLENILLEYGIKYIQGIPFQLSPDNGRNYRKIFHYQGQGNSIGQLYFVRNCFFEPSLRPGFDWINEIMRRLEIIFFWGKPAIIGTHRLNYIGALDEKNRRHTLNLFSDLIKKLLKRWPDIEFTTTDKLGESYDINFERI